MADLTSSIRSYLRGKGSPLAAYANDFVSVGNQYGIDPRFLVSVSGAETGFGKAGEGLKNIIAYGGGGHRQHPSVRATLVSAAKGLTDPNFVYLGQGNDTIAEIGGKWAPVGASNDPTNLNSNWVKTVRQFYSEQGGNPNQPVIGGGYKQAAQALVGNPRPVNGGKGADPHAGHDHGTETTTTTDTYGRPSLTDDTVGAIQSFIRSSEEAVLRGYDQPDPYQLLSTLEFSRPVQRTVRQVAGPTDPTNPPRTGRPAPDSGAPSRGSVKGAIPGSPVPGQRPQSSTHPTAGLAGYPAYDYMAPAGTKTVAPVSGTVIRLSGKDPKLGGPSGGALGYSVYLKGDDGRTYFMTHIDKLSVKAGQRVKQGQQIAVVADGPPSWSSPHVHMGVSG